MQEIQEASRARDEAVKKAAVIEVMTKVKPRENIKRSIGLATEELARQVLIERGAERPETSFRQARKIIGRTAVNKAIKEGLLILSRLDEQIERRWMVSQLRREIIKFESHRRKEQRAL